ncbi:MAG: pyruvate kinase [Bacteroidota bacterium]
MKIVDHQNTKIVATVGPACSSPEKLLALAKAGVNIFRLNFSHGSHEDHLKVIQHISAINEQYNLYIGILADLQGPKLRVGQMENNGLPIKAGQILTFTNEECVGNADKIYMSYQQFAQDVKVGEKVLVDDGKLEFEVMETNGIDQVKLKVLFGGVLKSNKGVNLPNTDISLPSMTEKDEKDLAFILKQPVNWIALSFVRSGKDMKKLTKKIKAAKHPAKTIAKVEKPEAIADIDSIIANSNAIMVARGDLGIEVPMEQLPTLQKDIIRRCNQRSRPVITATQMMDSMIENPSPTRAEITDVANAVLDGTDAVMLSGETSVGKHPVLVVEAMNKIIAETEKHFSFVAKRPKPAKKSRTFFSDAICLNAAKLSEEINAKAIIGMTTSGYTAFKVSSYRPKAEIFIFSDQDYMLATLNLVWGVKCFYYDKFTTTDGTISDVAEILRDRGELETGDTIVNLGSMPIKKRHRTNMMKITVVE